MSFQQFYLRAKKQRRSRKCENAAFHPPDSCRPQSGLFARCEATGEIKDSNQVHVIVRFLPGYLAAWSCLGYYCLEY